MNTKMSHDPEWIALIDDIRALTPPYRRVMLAALSIAIEIVEPRGRAVEMHRETLRVFLADRPGCKGEGYFRALLAGQVPQEDTAQP